MKQTLFIAVLFCALAFVCQPAVAQNADTEKKQFVVTGPFKEDYTIKHPKRLARVIKRMGISIFTDSTYLYDNGGRKVTVTYPENAFNEEGYAGSVSSSDQDTSYAHNGITFGPVTTGSQKIAGVNIIKPLSRKSFVVMRNVPGQEQAVYTFYKHKAMRNMYYPDGKNVEEKVLP